MPSIELGSRWKMQNGETLTASGMVVSTFNVWVCLSRDYYTGERMT